MLIVANNLIGTAAVTLGKSRSATGYGGKVFHKPFPFARCAHALVALAQSLQDRLR
jgi:hypothetical protein